jgi:hypothetical protein
MDTQITPEMEAEAKALASRFQHRYDDVLAPEDMGRFERTVVIAFFICVALIPVSVIAFISIVATYFAGVLWGFLT